MSRPTDAVLQDALLRMIVPMRREFGHDVDLARMRHDYAYASAVVTEAMTSPTARLRESARVVEQHWRDVFAAAMAAHEPAREAAAAESLRRTAAAAARGLIDLIGPGGEPLAIRLERATDGAGLERLLREAHDRIAGQRGAAAARAYLQRVGGAAGG